MNETPAVSVDTIRSALDEALRDLVAPNTYATTFNSWHVGEIASRIAKALSCGAAGQDSDLIDAQIRRGK